MKLTLRTGIAKLPLEPGTYEIGRDPELFTETYIRGNGIDQIFCEFHGSISRFCENGSGHLTLIFDGSMVELVDNKSTKGSRFQGQLFERQVIDKPGTYTIQLGANMKFGLTLKV